MRPATNRAVGIVVGADNITHRLDGLAAAKSFFNLLRCQLRPSTRLYAGSTAGA
jgi:hypothetical protein